MLTISELPEYLDGLVSRTIYQVRQSRIDIEGNKKYLESKNEDTVNMTEDEIKKRLLGKCFLKFADKFLDAMENFNIDIVV